MITYRRTVGPVANMGVPFGPRPSDARDDFCPACGKDFTPGDFTGLALLGPGGDPESRERCAAGRPYNARSIEVHWECATGAAPPLPEGGGE